MIVGVGVDLVSVPRMERILARSQSGRFVDRVFSEEEAEACRATAHPSQGFAARFAAKEALVKAIGTGFSKGVTPSQISVKGNENQRPTLELRGRAREIADSMSVTGIHVSLTHTRDTACAFVVVERTD